MFNSLQQDLLTLGCKGLCVIYDKVGGGKESVYAMGYKRCSGCSYSLNLAVHDVRVVIIHCEPKREINRIN